MSRTHTFSRLGLLRGSLVFALCLMQATHALAGDLLSRIEASLAQGSEIMHIPTAAFAEKLAASDSGPVLFDVRNPDEFAVSHLPGAIRIDPETAGTAFLEQYGGLLETDEVIFYCSTGRRSTALAEEVAQTIRERDLSLPSPANLQGGIFRWHNEGRMLVDAHGATEAIHPYNWIWKNLLSRKALASYEPQGF
ncbi:MAG: rhodanese-like domain-containing protein [Pseudomonadales bacterium]|nr:rhodanese-like domain-containing protein [Pseudomonadales bacterium]